MTKILFKKSFIYWHKNSLSYVFSRLSVISIHRDVPLSQLDNCLMSLRKKKSDFIAPDSVAPKSNSSWNWFLGASIIQSIYFHVGEILVNHLFTLKICNKFLSHKRQQSYKDNFFMAWLFFELDDMFSEEVRKSWLYKSHRVREVKILDWNWEKRRHGFLE